MIDDTSWLVVETLPTQQIKHFSTSSVSLKRNMNIVFR
jgi:hypothetical protein